MDLSRLQLSLHLDRGAIWSFVFALLVLFIQSGFSYYLSVQTAALLFVIVFLLHSKIVVCVKPLQLAVFMLFGTLLIVTAVLLPEAISQNSSNMLMTVIGILGYVALIIAMLILRPVYAEKVLLFYKRSSATIILLIVILVALTELGLFSSLNREYFILQNVDLVTNYSALKGLLLDLAARKARGVKPDIDLFYGEQSFLSLVMFVCLVSYVISSRALDRLRMSLSEGEHRVGAKGIALSLIFAGVGCMVYIQSFSSMFYAVIVVAALLAETLLRPGPVRLSHLKALGLTVLLVVIAIVAMKTYPYYLHRITTFSESLSAQQRFGILLNFLPQDFMFGLHEASRMPSFGFHNGIIYIAMMGGIGGACLLAYLLYCVIVMARPLEVAALAVLAVLAVFTQNGAIFSPNKLVILSFLLLPLSCTSLVKRNERQSVYLEDGYRKSLVSATWP